MDPSPATFALRIKQIRQRGGFPALLIQTDTASYILTRHADRRRTPLPEAVAIAVRGWRAGLWRL
jgi:hypothetical protein